MRSVMAARHANLYPGTEAEAALEPAVAALGVPYRWQYPLYLFGPLKYFPDFAFPGARVVFEVDDRSHNRADKRRADAERTAALEAAGWVVVRCTNDEAITDPFGTVARMAAESHLHQRWALASRNALPAAAGDRQPGRPLGATRGREKKWKEK